MGRTSYTRAMDAVDNRKVFGDWTVLKHVPGSTTKVVALCAGCNIEKQIDVFDLRKGRLRCQSCANKVKFGTFQPLPAEVSILNDIIRSYRKAADKRNYSYSLRPEVVAAFIYKDCYYCGSAPSRIVSTISATGIVNGIDRVDNSIGYEESNCVTCCKICNYMKRTMGLEDFINHCRRIANKHD